MADVRPRITAFPIFIVCVAMKYQNPEDCLRTIRELPMEDPEQVQRIMQDMLSTLAAVPPAAEAHLEVLEACRVPLDTIQRQAAKVYSEHPLPPDSAQNETLLLVVSLWQLMAHSYAQVDRHAAKENTLVGQQALLSQRHLFYTGLAIFEYFRSHRALPPGRWAKLHQGFISAEERNIAHIRVPDPLNPVWHAQSPLEAFTSVLLVDLGNPFGRNEQEFGWLCRWAQRLAPYCRLLSQEAAEAAGTASQTATYGLNLGTDCGLRPLGVLQQNDTLRCFEGSELANQFHAILNQFKQGVQPSALGLGDDCPQETGARLLLSLYRPWGLGSVGRRFPRRGAEGIVEMTGDWFLIGYHIDGSELSSLKTSHSAETEKTTTPDGTQNFDCERWQLVNQSVNGFRLRMRPQKERLLHQQLVALRPPGHANFLLGQVSWLMFRDDGVMEAGVMLLSESPQLVSFRHVQQPEKDGEAYVSLVYRQAFWLPKDRTSRQPETFIFQAGQCKLGQSIVIEDGTDTWCAKIDRRLFVGPNFEQFTYVWQENVPSGVTPTVA